MGEVLVDHIREYIEGEANDAHRSGACDEVVEVIRAYLFSLGPNSTARRASANDCAMSSA